VKLLADFARNSEHSDVLLEKLNRMLNYAESQTCRRKTLLSYFSEQLQEDCGNCDVCNHPPDFIDGTVMAQMALSGVVRTAEKIGANMLVQLLRGAKTSELMAKGYHTLKTYGVGINYSVEEWQHFINQLINLGVLEIAYAENFNLHITDFGRQVLLGEATIKLAEFKKKQLASKAAESFGENVNSELFELLRVLRKQIAESENVPPYVVFSDASLKHMSDVLPSTYAEMKEISGVGNQKLAKYGALFLTEIARYNNTETDFGELPSGKRSNRKPSKQKGGTYKITLGLYEEGLDLSAIAQKRGLAQSTVASHLVKLFQDGEAIDLNRFVDTAQVDKVLEVVKTINVSDRLTPIYEALNEEVPYEDIRFSLGILESEGRLT
jgi:ATP-dependent DNA helicase RecQ